MLVICGLPRIGKTAVGNQLSHQLQLPVLDLDVYCENVYRYFYKKSFSCSEIVRTHQESLFRKLEHFCLTLIQQHYRPSIISLGGGTLLYPPSAAIIKNLGRLIYLETPVEDYFPIIKERGLPETLKRFSQEELKAHLQERVHIFKQLADLSIVCDKYSCPKINSEKIIHHLSLTAPLLELSCN